MIRSGTPKRGTLISRSALGIALALGTVVGGTLVSVEPAHAQKKPKQQSAKITPSKGFLAAAAPAQQAIEKAQPSEAAAVADARAKLDQAFAVIENQDDRYMAGSFAVGLGGKIQDNALQQKGVAAMLESGKADAETRPKLLTAAGQLAYQSKDYAGAQQYLQQAVDAGVSDGEVMALLGEAYIANNQLDQGLGVLKSAIDKSKASGQLAGESWYKRGIGAAYNAKNLNQAAEFGALLIRDYPTPENVGVAATVVRSLGGFASQETLDLMRLMGRTNSYAEERDYIEYIEAADPRRHPGEVVKVIDAGVAAGKLRAADPFVADAKTQTSGRLSADRAALAGYEADARKASATEATVSGAADALLSYGEAGKAEELYAIALNKPGVDQARALNRMGIAQVDQGKYAEAQQTFAKITGKRQPIAKLWSAYAASKASPAAATPPQASAQ